MTEYIIKDITAEADAEAYIVNGKTPFDAINKFDGLLREKGICVNHAIVSVPDTRWIFTTESVKLDKYYKQESYEIYPKKVEE